MLDLVHTPSNDLIERLFPDIVLDIDIKPIEITNSPAPISISPKLSPDDKIKRAFSLLKGKMEQALDGGLDPAIYVMSADAGTGKSTAVQTLLAEWKEKGFPGDGAIIFLNTLAEVDTYRVGAGLDNADYAVLSPDATYARYGAGREAAKEAPVLFVTHSMAYRRLPALPSFKNAEFLYYKGRPRALRVWDEACLPVQYASFDLNDLHMLPSALRGRPRHLVARFEELQQSLVTVSAGDLIPIPFDIRAIADGVLTKGRSVSEQARRTLEALSKLAGSNAQINGSAGGGWYCVGIGLPIPTDMAPLFVLDASARLTRRYGDWSAYGMKVEFLEPAPVHYGNLAVHWWDKGCGQTAMRNADSKLAIMTAVADLINSKPKESFLLVMGKEFCIIGPDGGPMVPGELSSVTNAERIAVTTWGRHLSSNDHRDVANVVLFGSYNYGDGAYDALALAAVGLMNGLATVTNRRKQEAAEFKNNVYQAVCRVRCRDITDGDCKAANAYLIMTDSDRRRELVVSAFPGCSIVSWAPTESKPKKADRVLSILLNLFQEKFFVTKDELTAACGSDDRSYLTKVNNNVRFKAALRANFISRTGSMYVRSNPIKIAS